MFRFLLKHEADSDLEPVILVFTVSLTCLYLLVVKTKWNKVLHSTFPFWRKSRMQI